MTTTDTASSDIMAPEAPWPLNKKIPGVRYGQRLVPQVIDERARSHPDHLFARIAKSTDISQGFHELTISQLANAINWTAYWLEGQIGRSEDFEVVALLVRIRLLSSKVLCRDLCNLRALVIFDIGFSRLRLSNVVTW